MLCHSYFESRREMVKKYPVSDREQRNTNNHSLEQESENSRRMDENELNAILKNTPGYLGTYARDELNNLKISHYPSFIIVNLDLRKQNGSHWIAIAMFPNDVYICDSLGALMPTPHFPSQLINFLYRVSFQRRLHITRRLQADNSTNCGLYCIYFIQMMVKNNFADFLSKFCNNYCLNDLIIELYFMNIL